MVSIIEILTKTEDLITQSIILPVVASAFLSVLTAEFRKYCDITWFQKKLGRNRPELFHVIAFLMEFALSYIFAFLLACTLLGIIYLIAVSSYELFNLLFNLFY